MRGEGGSSSTGSTPRQPSKKPKSRRAFSPTPRPVPLEPLQLNQQSRPTGPTATSARKSLDFSSEPTSSENLVQVRLIELADSELYSLYHMRYAQLILHVLCL